MTMVNPAYPEDTVYVDTLRPVEWVEASAVRVDSRVSLWLPELGLEGMARVIAVEPCPPIEPGPGRVVLSTVRHSSAALMRIEFVDSDSPLRLTPEHRLYSEDRDDWAPAGDLRPGEFVRTIGGPLQVATISPVPGRHAVYNLEVETTHCYYAGEPAVLSHNAAACIRAGGEPAKRVVGTIVKGFRRHGIHRVIERGVNPRAILSTLRNPRAIVQQSGGRLKFIGDEAIIVINEYGEVVTAVFLGAAR